MSTVRIFSVYDSAVGAYLRLFQSMTEAEAMRALTVACWDPNNQFHTHAEDFSLMHVGDFDDVSGEVTPCVPSRVCGLASIRDQKLRFDESAEMLAKRGELKEVSRAK